MHTCVTFEDLLCITYRCVFRIPVINEIFTVSSIYYSKDRHYDSCCNKDSYDVLTIEASSCVHSLEFKFRETECEDCAKGFYKIIVDDEYSVTIFLDSEKIHEYIPVTDSLM